MHRLPPSDGRRFQRIVGAAAAIVLLALGVAACGKEAPADTLDDFLAGWRSGNDAGGASFYWRALHGGRRSIVIDLTADNGPARLIALAESACGKSCSASAFEMMVTSSVPAPSSAEKPRPRKSGMSIVFR